MLEFHQGTVPVMVYVLGYHTSFLTNQTLVFESQSLATITRLFCSTWCFVHYGASLDWRDSADPRTLIQLHPTWRTNGCHLEAFSAFTGRSQQPQELWFTMIQGHNKPIYQSYQALRCKLHKDIIQCLSLPWTWYYCSSEGGWNIETRALSYLSIGAIQLTRDSERKKNLP